ncbi:NADP-dependent phosphogluconate dehydrogenase [Vagococcus xieshaowenii]|uniref:6-phosphogluconate dehydrogenase, decarboxylating n=1 Tax=Vagococcus xieshaowenii TaxID=2562451 RepID=A0AAJ5EH89_9ENTE|nr:NADP-dependent phosphogluconate dehydrogenase [Vagococcus xieshaowenii]QCA28856.1 NADP-dependent phosphogluconate dehydrogenase [Vagococcus xieshaowenii]TFZ43437.1 NADP-dependent phosphogluconate dehydrogenase [Vagococcus xieshaowenii]
MKQQVGVVGMAVMGKNLALNIESKGYHVAIYNRTAEKTKLVIEENSDKNLWAAYDIEEFVNNLETPRRIILMVQAGNPTDQMINQLLPFLEKGDILVDGGNTFFQDTRRRHKELADSGIHFIGMGVSGGEEGALKGPALMPGGEEEAYRLIAPMLEKIAAKATDGKPCVAYMGGDGAGHFVKMVHNGIEYGDMQLIAESYDLLRKLRGVSIESTADIFKEWNEGELDSFLIEITSNLLTKQDEKAQQPLVEMILDSAGNKGTGKWTSQSALDLGVALPLVTEAVFARYISTIKDERVIASKLLFGPTIVEDKDNDELVEKIRQALYFSKIMSYAQGFAQYKVASETYNWQLNFGEIAQIFREGCIIRARFLQKITEAYERNPELDNLLLDEYFIDITKRYQESAREVANLAIASGIPVPTLSSAISYYDSYRSAQLPANIIQAQRDYFGAHTFKRVDMPGDFHANWY